MRLKLHLNKNSMNYHGTQAKGEPWNNETVHGYKVSCVDLLKNIKQRERDNPEGGKTCAKWYKRFILYLPSGAWWNLDVCLFSRCSI